MSRKAFFQGQIVPMDEAKISISTHGFLYGTACFEGIRGYWSEEDQDILIFRLKEHYQRLLDSCKILRIKSAWSVDELCRITADVVAGNGDRGDVYIRPVFYKATESIGVTLLGLKDEFTVFSVPFGEYLDLSRGLRACVSSWQHNSDNNIPPRAKLNGAYINAALAKSEAIENGYDEAIFLAQDGHVAEGSAENIFLVKNGKLVTPIPSGDILEGITRATIIELARELGIEVVERVVDRTELYLADELFFTGTGAQITPAVEVDHRAVGDGQIGPISKRLQQLYFDVVKGRAPKYRHWCTPAAALAQQPR